MTATLTELEQILEDELVPYTEDEDPNRKTHIVNPPGNLHIWKPGMSAQDIVDVARLTHQEVVALCGYRWVPKHDPDKYDACSTCVRIAGELMRGRGE